jgi:hypothetical protein
MMRRLASLAIIIAVMCFAVAWSLKAHQAPSGWAYPYECCSNQDCARVAPESVRERRGGWHVTVLPGTHPQVPAGAPAVMVFVPVNEARPSPDGEWHICLHPSDKRLLCFFNPPGGV